MATRAGPEVKTETNLRATLRRFAYGLLVAVTLGALVVGKVEIYVFDGFKGLVGDVVAPIVDAMAAPLRLVRVLGDHLGGIGVLAEENAELRVENARLLQWQTLARRLDSENRELRALLKLELDAAATAVAARALEDTGGAFARSLLLNAGRRQGVARDQTVISGDGLVGRIMQVGARASRALTIVDGRSRIPVLVGKERHRAILVGDNGPRPHLRFLPRGILPSEGDAVITSGRSGVFPAGLPVGEVVSVDSSEPRVRAHVDWGRLEFVRIVDYGADDGLELADGR